MSSGFVSGGTIDNPAERDDAWHKAQEELAETRRRKEESQQHEGKSLYEVLQANKDAKQEAFEEATRLKNQYRALNDDEVEFLDAVLESTRKQEAAVQKETLEQLDLFRKHQEEIERKALAEQNAGSPPAEDAQWAVSGRKRRRGNDKDGGLLKGVKLRKASSGAETATEVKKAADPAISKKSIHNNDDKGGVPISTGNEEHSPKNDKGVMRIPETRGATTATKAASPTSQPPNSLALGLGYASSDEDD